MKSPPSDLATRLLDVAEQVLRTDPPPRLEDVARLVGASRATLYYYFSGRGDLLAFMLTAHARQGAEAIRAQVDPEGPAPARLRTMVAAMVDYLGQRPGICAGLLAAMGQTGRMSEVMQANDTWIAAPLRDLLTDGRNTGAFTTGDAADAANAIIGAVLLGVLGRSLTGADATDARFQQQLTRQVIRGVLTG